MVGAYTLIEKIRGKSVGKVYIYILQQCLVITISLGGFVADQMWYNLKSAQYLR